MLSYYFVGAFNAFNEELRQTAETPVITQAMFFVILSTLRIAGDIIAQTQTFLP